MTAAFRTTAAGRLKGHRCSSSRKLSIDIASVSTRQNLLIDALTRSRVSIAPPPWISVALLSCTFT